MALTEEVIRQLPLHEQTCIQRQKEVYLQEYWEKHRDDPSPIELLSMIGLILLVVIPIVAGIVMEAIKWGT